MTVLSDHVSKQASPLKSVTVSKNRRFFATLSSALFDARAPIDGRRGPIVERLMGPLVVEEGEVPRQTTVQPRHRVVSLNVNVLVFHAPPEPLDEHVVQRPPPPVHAYRRPGRFQPPGELRRRELRPLAGVEDLRPPPPQGLFEHLQAERPVERI